ncbi:MAG: adenylate/guanylate cyclase domain-containing protein, partial [Gammaproteobacteria bacterium]|nr:adenylate/guanylate cyclase domain-containing protein [Gammaproteobacteria bacterium]
EDQRPGVGEEATLERIATFKDPVLSRIWTPDTERMFMLPNLERTTASTVKLNRTQYAFLYRNIELYGPKPWTIGVYFDVEQSGNQVVRRLLLSSIAGLVVFAVALVAAVLLSRRLSHPVQAIAHVARAVREGRLADATRLPHSLVREFDDANQSINGMVTDLRERETIRETLGRYVPEQVARSLLSAGGKLEVETAEATVLFCDIEQFTMITEQLGPQRIVDLLNAFFSTMVEILERHDGVVTQFQGDAILAVFNIPVSNPHHAESAAKAAQEMLRAVRSQTFEGTQLHIRIGINTGFVVAGAVGAAGRLSYTVHGDAVNLASRLENLNKDYGTRILLSGSTGAKIQNMNLQPRGRIAVRGQSEEVDVFELPAE